MNSQTNGLELEEDDFLVDKVTNNVYVTSVQNKLYADVNSVAIVFNDFLTVIDTTVYPYHARKFTEKVEEQSGLKTNYLFLTHQHADHVFGAKSYEDTIIIGSNLLLKNLKDNLNDKWSEKAVAEMKDDKEDPNYEITQEIKIILPTVTFEEHMKITDEKNEVQFYQVRGHTSESGFAYYPKEKVLIAGDLLFNKQFPYAGDPTCDPDV